jgi:peptide/nickel transport system substrate-binding protein
MGMNRREFARLMALTGVAAGAGIPLGLTRAAGQTKGGTLNTIIQPEPPILVTALNQQQPTLTLGGKIYESLLRYGTDLKPLPGLAESWTVSPDGLTYTFKLFPKITFHDGHPLTSEDVVFSVMKVLTETHARARGTFLRIDKAEAPDPLTVVFTLKTPFAPFLNSFDCTTAPILPKHVYDGTDFRKNPANAQAIGSGPFKLKEWVKGSHIHLVKHEGYYRAGEPHLDEIIYRVIPDAASRSVALEQGTVQLTQWTDVELFDVARLSKLPNLEMTTKGYEFFAPHFWLEMNNRIAPMNDKRFRQAVMYAIDRKAMLNRVFFGLGKVATGPVSSKTRFYEKNVKDYDFSIDKSKALLDEMGLKPGEGGKRVSIKFLVPPYGELWQRSAEFLRQSLSRVGIDLQLVGLDLAGWAEKSSNWDFEMTTNLLYQFGDPALGVSRSYITANIRKGILFSNVAGYSNPEVDRLFEAAAVETVDAKRQGLYSAVQKILVDDVPMAWLIEQDFPNFYDKKLKNVITTGIGVHETFGTVTLG